MGGQDQWGQGGQGGQGYGQQPPPPPQQGWGAPPPPPAAPGGRPALRGGQLALIGLSFVLVVGAGAGVAYGIENAKKSAAPDPGPTRAIAGPTATPSPSGSGLPDSSVTPSDTPSPTPSSSRTADSNVMTAAQRGDIRAKDFFGPRVQHGGPTAVRVGMKDAVPCDQWLVKNDPKSKLFGTQGCQRVIRASYVSEKRDIYMSIAVFQFADQKHRQVINDRIRLRDMPIRFMLPPAGYDTTKLKASKNASVMINNNSNSECLVITQTAYADGREAAGQDETTLSDWGQLVGSEAKMVLLFQKPKKG